MRPLLAAACGLLLLSGATSAFAFCRTTTCDPKDPTQGCELDAERCVLSGKPLYWPGACISFSVNRDASPLRSLDWETTEQLVSAGFNSWMAVDCGGGARPSIAMTSRSPVACDATEYNQRQPNANIWAYRDTAWPYAGGDTTLALTTITFNTTNGEIFDADVEINSAENELTTGDTQVRTDMLSIVTHEAGHFLGLSHTNKTESTMFASYVAGSTGLRSLSPDDAAGMCAVYPPGRDADSCSFDPRHGFSGQCSGELDEGCRCGLVGAGRPGGAPLAAFVMLGLMGAAWRRRSRANATPARG